MSTTVMNQVLVTNRNWKKKEIESPLPMPSSFITNLTRFLQCYKLCLLI